MGGIVFSALAGGLAGLGQGMSQVADQEYLKENLKLKAELDSNREVLLQTLRNQSAEKVANISADTSRYATDTQAETSRDVANIHGETSRVTAETSANAHVMGASIAADASRANAQTHAASAERIARIQQDTSAASHVQVDNEGNAFVVKSGKAEYLTDEDGDRVQSSKDLTPATKALVDGYQKRLQQLEKDLNDPQKGMLIRSNEKEAKRYADQIEQLQSNIYTALGLDPGMFAPAKRAPAGDKRPPLTSYVK